MPSRYTLNAANERLRARDYEAALGIYLALLDSRPDLKEILNFNINLIKRRRRVKRRAAVFAFYNKEGIIHSYVLRYIKALRQVTDFIVFCADNELGDSDLDELRPYVNHFIVGRHNEYDFGSYKRGLEYLQNSGQQNNLDSIVLCNDSCYGPITDFQTIFSSMESRNLDFWGITRNVQYEEHLQSYFLVFTKGVFCDHSFANFFAQVTKHDSVDEVIKNYEVTLTKRLERRGYKWGSFLNHESDIFRRLSRVNKNITVFPSFMIDSGCQLIKVKALRYGSANLEGIRNTLNKIKHVNPALMSDIRQHSIVAPFESSDAGFSIILPTLNRKHLLPRAIDSVISQTSQNYELIIVDDHSDDGTEGFIHERYKEYFASGKFRYLRNDKKLGVSQSRNRGLNVARNPWIAYLDSDNALRPHFLSVFQDTIAVNPNISVMYAKYMTMSDGLIHGKEFSLAALRRANYIDLGAFAHKKELIAELGGFDVSLARLVDWELILRLCSRYTPFYLQVAVVDYCDDDSVGNRISKCESFEVAYSKIVMKHSLKPKITTVILAHNHERTLKQAIESAVAQVGNFEHEIFVLDDASSDRTWDHVVEYARKYNYLRGCKHESNIGQAKNFHKAFTIGDGDFVAVLEGDDYWTDSRKLAEQLSFLVSNPDCSMVFSQISVLDEVTGKQRFLNRQRNIKTKKLSGADFLSHSSMNLICNFSSCFFRRNLLVGLPEQLFSERLNEVAVAFFMERFGSIGFIQKPMSVYRQHSAGLWTGLSEAEQNRVWISARRDCLTVCRDVWRPGIEQAIKQRLGSLVNGELSSV